MALVGNSLLNLGKALARELGPYAEFAATSTSGANDLVISTAMADSEAPAERYGGYYLYSHSGGPAGQQRHAAGEPAHRIVRPEDGELARRPEALAPGLRLADDGALVHQHPHAEIGIDEVHLESPSPPTIARRASTKAR